MRNRFHREPVNRDNIIRPETAGTKENPDYVVNIQGELYSDFNFPMWPISQSRLLHFQ